eukprot:124053-Chlamydomonas_euryale.AAC.7
MHYKSRASPSSRATAATCGMTQRWTRRWVDYPLMRTFASMCASCHCTYRCTQCLHALIPNDPIISADFQSNHSIGKSLARSVRLVGPLPVTLIPTHTSYNSLDRMSTTGLFDNDCITLGWTGQDLAIGYLAAQACVNGRDRQLMEAIKGMHVRMSCACTRTHLPRAPTPFGHGGGSKGLIDLRRVYSEPELPENAVTDSVDDMMRGQPRHDLTGPRHKTKL